MMILPLALPSSIMALKRELKGSSWQSKYLPLASMQLFGVLASIT